MNTLSATFDREAMFYNALAVGTQLRYEILSQLKSKYATWERVWESQAQLFLKENPEQLWTVLVNHSVGCILPEHPDYPPLLRQIDGRPLGVYVRGKLPKDKLPIAIVGTRKASVYGKRHARRFAHTLAEHDISIVSGLAFGIDKAAHEGALEAGGHTVAVLAHGLDNIYPGTHIGLAEKILETGGALISEYPFGMPSYPGNFVNRNRIISGMARGVVLIEAPHGSGALKTTDCAANQGRDVFVVPGQIDDPNYQGSHDLLLDGAKFATGPEHVMEVYGIEPRTHLFSERNTPTPTDIPEISSSREVDSTVLILETLRNAGTPLAIDKITELTKLNIQVVLAIITILILRHTIEETPHGIRLIS